MRYIVKMHFTRVHILFSFRRESINTVLSIESLNSITEIALDARSDARSARIES